MQALIFANGEFSENKIDVSEKERLIIAADGGALACGKLNILPDIVIGDFDSLSEIEFESFKKKGVKQIRYSVKKDKTDLELAIEYALNKNADEIIIYGATGGRSDMTVANVLLLTLPELQDKNLKIIDRNQEISVIFPQRQRCYEGKYGDTLSLIPVSCKVEGVNISGLEYPLVEETLYRGSTRSISNRFEKNTAQISIKKGLLLCVIIRNFREK